MIWNILAYAFTGQEDHFQLWSSLLTTLFGVFGLFTLFYVYPRRKQILYLNYIAWASLFLITFLELIFLISLIVNGNNYQIEHTNYNTVRIQYYHSAK